MRAGTTSVSVSALHPGPASVPDPEDVPERSEQKKSTVVVLLS